MPRKPRIEYSGAFYHVITRGNQRQNLFHDNQDREFYLDRLEQYRKRYGFTIYAYVLMSNHVHLLVETAKASLSKIMQGWHLAILDILTVAIERWVICFKVVIGRFCATGNNTYWSWCVIFISIRRE